MLLDSLTEIKSRACQIKCQSIVVMINPGGSVLKWVYIGEMG